MDVTEETGVQPISEITGLVGKNDTAYRPRGYQLEMLEASLKQNVIVAVCC